MDCHTHFRHQTHFSLFQVPAAVCSLNTDVTVYVMLCEEHLTYDTLYKITYKIVLFFAAIKKILKQHKRKKEVLTSKIFPATNKKDIFGMNNKHELWHFPPKGFVNLSSRWVWFAVMWVCSSIRVTVGRKTQSYCHCALI